MDEFVAHVFLGMWQFDMLYGDDRSVISRSTFLFGKLEENTVQRRKLSVLGIRQF